MGDVSEFFSRYEFKCPCCDFDAVDVELLKALNWVRLHFGSPVVINSACRCEKHNADVGGSKKSQHLYGKAADIYVINHTPRDVYEYLDSIYSDRYGLGLYERDVGGWCHVDVKDGYLRRWKG